MNKLLYTNCYYTTKIHRSYTNKLELYWIVKYTMSFACYTRRSPPTLGFSFTNLLLKVGDNAVIVAVDSSSQQRVAFFNQSKNVIIQFTVDAGINGRVATGVLNGTGIGSGWRLFFQSSHTHIRMQHQSNLTTTNQQQTVYLTNNYQQ